MARSLHNLWDVMANADFPASGVAVKTPDGCILSWNNGTPSDGTSGTHAGLAAPGCLCCDTSNGVVYYNTNTLASPAWTRQYQGTS